MNDSNRNSGIGLSGAFLLLFVGLKLGRVIDWDWVWVLSPLWIPLGLLVAGVAVALALYFPVKLIGDVLNARRMKQRIRDAAKWQGL